MSLRIAIRCDGGRTVGAGHVGRCVPIALALKALGAEPTFVGSYEGVAEWLLGRTGLLSEPCSSGPCGLRVADWTAAVVDLYLGDGEACVCELAETLPIATPGEASRCSSAGVWIDYHLGSTTEVSARRLGGPSFAPLDPRLAGTARQRDRVESVLVVAGGSERFTEAAARWAEAVAERFPEADILVPEAVVALARCATTPIRTPFDLVDITPRIDAAVTAAGMTTYELASAGVPVLAVALVENQRAVIEGCAQTGTAITADGIGSDPTPDVRAGLARLADPALRAALRDAAMPLLDGRGANRIAKALLTAWTDAAAPGIAG